MAVRRRPLVAGLLVLLVLGGLAALGFFADDFAEQRVERAEAGSLQAELGTPAAPTVDVEGWPFLTQVLTRRHPRVHVVADDLPSSAGYPVPVEHLDLVLTDVTTQDWYQSLEAAQVEGTARLGYDGLTQLTKVPLTPAGEGRVRIERRTSVFGIDLLASVTGAPRLDVEAQTVTLADTEIRLGEVQLPRGAAQALVRTVLQPIPLEGLPLGLRVSGLEATDAGVLARVSGSDVVLRRE